MENKKNAADLINLNDKENISSREYSLKVKAYKLNELIKIYRSDINDFSKIMKMIKFYDSYRSFVKCYEFSFTKKNKIPNYLECNKNEYFLVADFYKRMEDNGSLAKAKYLTVMLPFLVDYKYSKSIMDDFINYNSFEINDFLKEYNISFDDFKNIVNVISVLDKNTYDRYLDKCKINEINKYNYCCNTIKDLCFGISNGIMSNGDKFDILVFLSKVPFDLKNRRSLFDFVKKNIPGCYDIIFNYMLNNGLLDEKKRMEIDKSFVLNGSSIINGRFISNDEIRLIYNYIIDNNLPTFGIVFNIVRDMYINGEIVLDSSKYIKVLNN